VFGDFIKNNTAVAYKSVDIAEDLKPDVVGSVLQLPFADKSFDVACAFEVLEHLPFEQFDKAVGELCRVARSHIVISVPHFGPMLSFSLKIPFIPQLRFAFKIPFSAKHNFQRPALLGSREAWISYFSHSQQTLFSRKDCAPILYRL